MTRNKKLVSTVVKTFGRNRKIVSGIFALAMLLPIGALAMDSTPKQTANQIGHLLPLPPIRHLESMRWLEWKPSAPVFKIDTLLMPDSAQPGVFRLPRATNAAYPASAEPWRSECPSPQRGRLPSGASESFPKPSAHFSLKASGVFSRTAKNCWQRAICLVTNGAGCFV